MGSATSAAERDAEQVQSSINALRIEARRVARTAAEMDNPIRDAASRDDKRLCLTLIKQQLQLEKTHRQLQRGVANLERMKANAEYTRVLAIQSMHMERAVRTMQRQSFDPARTANTAREYQSLMTRNSLTNDVLDDAINDMDEEDEHGLDETEQAQETWNRLSAVVGHEKAAQLMDPPQRVPTTTRHASQQPDDVNDDDEQLRAEIDAIFARERQQQQPP